MFEDAVLDLVADIVDELVGVFKSPGTVKGDQAFSGRKLSYLFIDRNRKISGDRADDDQIIFIKAFQKLPVGRGVGGDPDQLAYGNELLLEDLAREGRVFSCDQYHISCIHEHIDESAEAFH